MSYEADNQQVRCKIEVNKKEEEDVHVFMRKIKEGIIN